MVFPATPLDLRVELLLGSTWTDITAGNYVYQRSGPAVVIRGRPDESSQASPSSGALELNNRDSRFSPRNATGPFYGLIGRNTPLRISVPEGASYLRSDADQASYASAPDSAGLSITGDTEIQVDLTLGNWNQAQQLAGKYAVTGGQRSWLLQLNDDATLTFWWSSDGTSGAGRKSATTTVPLPQPALRRQAIKVTLATATGTVTFWTAPAIGGSWTQLGAAVVAGANAVFDSTAAVQVGYVTDGFAGVPGIYGKIHAFRLLSGIGGTVRASPDFTVQAAGAASFADAQANTWTLAGTAEISDRRYRFHGEVPAWPPKWESSQTDIYTPVAAAGILRRLGQGKSPLHSALYRAYVRLTGSLAPAAYWPGEDGSGATSVASALGGPAMLVTGKSSFGNFTGFACSGPLPLLSLSAWTGKVPRYTGNGTGNSLYFVMAVPASGAPNGAVIARIFTTGTARRADLVYGTGGTLQMVGYTASGAVLLDTGAAAAAVNGDLLLMQVQLLASGGNVNAQYVALQSPAVSFGTAAAPAAGSVGIITSVVINPNGNINDTAVGHVAVADNASVLPVSQANSFAAWAGENAGIRFSRLCAEEGIGFRGRGQLSDTVAMGPQLPLKLLDLLQECEDADRGMIFEPRQALALGYRTRVSMQNQAAAATLSYTHADLAGTLEPVDDDQRTLNDVTVQRTGGSSSRQTLDTGALSTRPPPAGVGRYDTSLTISLGNDNQADDEAGWLLHMGTVDEPRYPVITANLARTEVAALTGALQEADIGDRIDITSPPPWLPPGSIKQIIAGGTETLGGYVFAEAWNAIPESPWEVGILDDLVLGHADTDGSTLHAGITSGAASMTVDTTANVPAFPLWTTAAGDFPFDVILGGEIVTVTNITGGASPQTFTITRSVNGVVKAHSAGEDIRLAHPMIISL